MSDLVAKKNRPPWLLAIILLCFTLSIVIISYSFYKGQVEQTQNIAELQLNTLAELKSNQINFWRSELQLDADRIQADPRILRSVESLVQNPNNTPQYLQNLEWMNDLLKNPNYSSVYLLDTQRKILVRTGRIDQRIGDFGINAVIESINLSQIVITDLFEDNDGYVLMDIAIPIQNPSDDSNSIFAVVILQIDPSVALFPMIESWPSTYETAETLLVRQEGDEVVYLNKLRFDENSPLTLRYPLSNTNLPAAMAVGGVTGIIEGTDYRNVSVIASIYPIKGTNWKLVAKIDREELFGSLKIEIWNIVLTLAFLILAIGLSLDVLWRRQSSRYYQNLYQTEVARRGLEEKYSMLFSQANDAILLIEEGGKIVEANDQAVKMYGYSLDELLSLSISDLRDELVVPQIRKDMEHVKNGTVNIFESTHRKKNGEKFSVDISSRYLSIDGKGFFQSLIRDVTQRKQAENRLRLSEMALKKAQQVSHVGSWYWNAVTNKIDRSDEMYQILGLDKDTSDADFYELFKKVIHPDDQKRIKQILEKANQDKALYSFETRITRPDGTERDIWVEAGEMVLDDKGNLTASSGIIQDITEKKKAEREIRKSENLLQKIYELLPVGLWITDKTGRLIRSNKMVKEIWGKDILVAQDEFQVFRGRRLPSREEIKPDDWASVHTISDGVTIRDEMIEIDAYDGKTKTILNYTTPILGETGELEGAIVLNLDISELKNAEKQLSNQLDELRRWNLATLGRENRIRDLKLEINELLVKQGLPPKYQSVEGDGHD